MQSALRVPGPDAPPPWPDAARTPFQAALERTLTSAPADVLAPPVYGQLQAGASALPLAGGQPAWLREVNLDPRLRVAAAAGTRVVQERQEQLMARAWEQAGAVNDANALLRRSQLARELGNVVMERHLAPLQAPDLLAMTQPAHAQIRLASATVDGELRASRVPEAVVSGAMRRLASPLGLIARRAVAAQPAPQPINMLAAVDRVAMTPTAPAPVGMVMMAGFAARLAAVDTRPGLSADAVRVQLLDRLAPEKTVLERTRAHRRACGHVDAARSARAGRDRAALRRSDVRGAPAGRALAILPGCRARRGRRRRAAGDHAASDRGLHGRFEPRAQPRAPVARIPGDARRDRVPAVLGRQRPGRRPRGARGHPPDLAVGERAAGRAPARRCRPARAARPRRAAAPLPDDYHLRRPRDRNRRARRDDPARTDVPRREIGRASC